MRHPKDGYTPFTLLHWERQYLRAVFGNVDEAGRRLIRRAYLEVAKKNGKSELAAGVALYMLASDGEPGAEIYGCATTKDQAGIVFRTAAAMVEVSPELRRLLRVVRSTKTILRRDDHTSFYRAVSADGDAQDGINPHCAIIDELHRWKTARHFELLDVMTKGTIIRKQPLIWEITTAGSTEDESPLAWREHEYTRGIEKKQFRDTSFFGKIFSANKDDDPKLRSTWEKANPSLETLGGFVPLKSLQSEADKAANQPSRLPAFKRYHLGIWGSSETEWMASEVWAACSGPLKSLVERPCYLGLDLSSTTDLTSLVALFPDVADDGTVTYDVLPFFWMAHERIPEREINDRVPYSQWRDAGHLFETQGNVIDLREIKKKIGWCYDVFSVQEVAYDPSHAMQLAIELDDEFGAKCVPIPQRFTHMSEPSKKLMELALAKNLRHAGHPVLSWNVGCLRMKSDDGDNIRPVKPDRAKSSKRIDGAVATIIALARAMGYSGGSVYLKRGVLTV